MATHDETTGTQGEPAPSPVSRSPAADAIESGDGEFAYLASSDQGEDWPARPRRRGLTMRVPTAVLLALLVAAGAFWVGAVVEKSDGTSTTSGLNTTALSRLRGLFSASRNLGGGGASPLLGGGGGFGAATTGILTDVKGNRLYLTDSSGKLIEVTISKSTTITSLAVATPATLALGDTVIVRGTSASSGVLSATSVVASAKNTSPGALAGAGGGGGRGAGAGVGSSTAATSRAARERGAFGG